MWRSERPMPLAATPREGTGKTAEGGPNGGWRSRERDWFASSAKALTPRHDDLEAGIWARGSFPPAAFAVYAITAAG